MATLTTPDFDTHKNEGDTLSNVNYNKTITAEETLWSNQQAINSSASIPSGTISMYGGSSAPTGWLLCDGSAVSRTTYSDLFSAISTTFGIGDGSTTFNIPNFQGIFPRGAGSQSVNGRTKGGGSLGDTNEDKFQGHIHIQGGNCVSGQGQYGTVARTASSAEGDFSVFTSNFAPVTSVPNTDGTNGTPRTGDTTEPSSLDIHFIIKT